LSIGSAEALGAAVSALLILIHRSAWKRNSANFAITEFSEDEMRRPTPCAVPLEGLQMCSTGSDAQ
jgi:hypothetical protein